MQPARQDEHENKNAVGNASGCRHSRATTSAFRSRQQTANSPGSATPATKSVRLGRSRLTGFRFGAFFQGRFTRKFYTAFVFNPDAFHPDHVPDFDDVFSAFYAEVGQLGNVDETILARQDLDECAELFYGYNPTLIGLTNLDLARHSADDLLGACHRFAAGRVDVDRTIVLDVNLRAGFRDNALDGFAAGSNERANFLRINLDRLDAWRVLRQLRTRLIQGAAHDSENLCARLLCALDCFGHDFVADAGKFQVELKTGHAVVGAAEFEIHVAEMIFRANDVGQELVTF